LPAAVAVAVAIDALDGDDGDGDGLGDDAKLSSRDVGEHFDESQQLSPSLPHPVKRGGVFAGAISSHCLLGHCMLHPLHADASGPPPLREGASRASEETSPAAVAVPRSHLSAWSDANGGLYGPPDLDVSSDSDDEEASRDAHIDVPSDEPRHLLGHACPAPGSQGWISGSSLLFTNASGWTTPTGSVHSPVSSPSPAASRTTHTLCVLTPAPASPPVAALPSLPMPASPEWGAPLSPPKPRPQHISPQQFSLQHGVPQHDRQFGLVCTELELSRTLVASEIQQRADEARQVSAHFLRNAYLCPAPTTETRFM
jgi:hypothetical protein